VESVLNRQKHETEKQLVNIVSEDPMRDPDHGKDNAASDTDAYEQSTRQRVESLQKELRNRLRAITHALFRIRRGKYGTCEICGKQIPEERMRIMPTATFCIDCERKKESS